MSRWHDCPSSCCNLDRILDRIRILCQHIVCLEADVVYWRGAAQHCHGSASELGDADIAELLGNAGALR